MSEKKDEYWISDNGVPVNNRNPKEGGVAWDRLKLLITDVFGKNVPEHVRILRLKDGEWTDHSTAELALLETA